MRAASINRGGGRFVDLNGREPHCEAAEGATSSSSMETPGWDKALLDESISQVRVDN